MSKHKLPEFADKDDEFIYDVVIFMSIIWVEVCGFITLLASAMMIISAHLDAAH